MSLPDDFRRAPGESETEFARRACEMIDRVRERVFIERADKLVEQLFARTYQRAGLQVPALDPKGNQTDA